MTYFLAGDSTVAPMKSGEEPLSGWGQALNEFTSEPVKNLAFGGATTLSFRESGAWSALIAALCPGDTVLIQFGHNDQKQPGVLDSRGGYSRRLEEFAREVLEVGALPILCTPCERRWFVDGRVTPTHGDFPNAVRDLAASLGVPLIDLTVFTTWLYEDLGDEGSRALLSHFAPGESPAWPDGLIDDTHFQYAGARRIAAFVAQAVQAIERAGGDLPAKGSTLVP